MFVVFHSEFTLTHVDEFIDELLTKDYSCDTALHRIQKRRDQQEALRALWHATYPDQELQDLISKQWKDTGWQGRDPSTDF
ncbi:hypothetical protein ABZP36_012958, partial [Zizania latifolia]